MAGASFSYTGYNHVFTIFALRFRVLTIAAVSHFTQTMSKSSWSDVSSGVPQGSVLGPILFFYYVNDLSYGVTSMVYTYADDTKLSRKIDGLQDCIQLHESLHQVRIGQTHGS